MHHILPTFIEHLIIKPLEIHFSCHFLKIDFFKDLNYFRSDIFKIL